MLSGLSTAADLPPPSSESEWSQDECSEEVPWEVLCESSAHKIHEEFEPWRGLIPCFIKTDDCDRDSWVFSIFIYFKYGRGKYSYARSPLIIDFEQLKLLDAFITRCDAEGNFHFPIKKYPRPPDQPYSEKIAREMRFLGHPRLRSVWMKRRCSSTQQEEITEYLRLSFSSASILLEREFHQILQIPPRLRVELKRHAMNILRSLQSQTQHTSSIKRMRKRKDEYDVCYVAARPLSRKYGGDTFNFRHWALKFVGKTSLLTIEFFDQGVVVRMIPNFSAASRRAFWYWWDDQKHHNFTDRWKILERFRVSESARDLSMYVQNWLLRGAQYRVIDNNCQHFCRDIVAVLNQNKALSLCSLLEHHQVTNFIPIIGWGDSFAEYARTYQVSKQLEKKSRKKRRHRHSSSRSSLSSRNRRSHSGESSDALSVTIESAPTILIPRETSFDRKASFLPTPSVDDDPKLVRQKRSRTLDHHSDKMSNDSSESDEYETTKSMMTAIDYDQIHVINEDDEKQLCETPIEIESHLTNSHSNDKPCEMDEEKDIVDVFDDDDDDERLKVEIVEEEREQSRRHVSNKDDPMSPTARRTGRHHFHRRRSKSRNGRAPRSRRPRTETSMSDQSSSSWFRWFATSGFGHRYR